MLLLLSIFMVSLTTSLGYDSATSCNPRATRRGRAQLLATIPCDLTIQAYCNLPGSAYPWKAVRRFVHENQGMMRRMYGDIRHISILKTEFENNEIEVDDIEEAAARYSRSGGKSSRRDRKSKYVYSEYQNGRVYEVLTEPHFRPTTTSTTTSTTTTTSNPWSKGSSSITTDPPSSSSSSTQKSTEKSSTMSYTEEIQQLKKKYQTLDSDFLTEVAEDSVESNSIYENTTEIGKIKEVIETSSQISPKNPLPEPEHISSTLKIIKIEPVPKVEPTQTTASSTTSTSSVKPTSAAFKSENNDQIDPIDDEIIVENDDRYREVEEAKTETIIEKSNPNKLTDRNDDFTASSAELVDTKATSTVNESTAAEAGFSGDDRKKSSTSQIAGQGQHMEGQLFQDSVQKNSPTVMMMGRGINACPVKEEVVAPFWANNTRGEVLALLNLYPFEQYVHWEKCTHEHKQMYCREGCRCEQQYRLHRLLAYDPHNECRGIFSDWFRFPSCCICKCYDIPNEFRVTSRSPRSPRESPLDTVQDELQRAVYEHATEDWYHRPNDNEEDDWDEEGQEEEDELDE